MSSKTAELEFTKMHGIGNDYVYIDCFKTPEPEDLESLAIAMSDRHTGVGGDGIILIEPTDAEADCKMRIFNADGSEAMMCGNGVRCVAKFYHDHINPEAKTVRVDTLSGIKPIQLIFNGDEVVGATVDMGEPILTPAEIPVKYDGEMMKEVEVDTLKGGKLAITAVSMGNPHGVIFLPTLEGFDVHGIGRELEIHPMWPNRANIEFAAVREGSDGSEIDMRVWERGSGETMACGTGSCATAVAAMLTKRSPRRVTIHLLGGDLEIEWAPNGHVMMTGPAEEVFTGTYHRRYKSPTP